MVRAHPSWSNLGASFLSIRIALDEIAPLTSIAHRTFWAMCALWLVVWAMRLPVPLTPRVWIAFLGMGLLNNVIPFGLMAWGQLHIETGLTSILNAATAIFGVIAAAIFFADERISARKGLGVTLGFAGVATAIGLENVKSFDLRSLAQLAVIVGTISYAMASVWARHFLSGLPPQVAAAGMLTGSSAVTVPLAWMVDGPISLSLQADTILAIAYFAIIATAGAYLLYYRVLAMAGSGNLMLVTLVIPPVAIILGSIVRDETLNPNAFAGFVLLAIGLAIIDGRILTLLRRRSVDRPPPPQLGHPKPENGAGTQTTMLYRDADSWRTAPSKRVLVFGMSGLGKTHMSTTLRDCGTWFHYSIDYRIGTRYMGERIADNAKAEAMKVPFLRDLLMSDSIYIGSNITFHNLSPVSTYLGKPGDPAKGGLPIAEYRRRQEQFQQSEIAALNDTGYFAERAQQLYGYSNFICDTGGSICEWVNPDDDNDPLMTTLSTVALPIWIKGDEAHTMELIARFDKAPKPMAYQPDFLQDCWSEYINETGSTADKVDPNAFVRWTYARALAHRQPRYEAMSRWGVTVTADDVAALKGEQDFIDLIADALTNKPGLL